MTTMPSLECDLVMKGGISSGVVYPKAITELSTKYRFRSIGGTSAGAIAAGISAAAEYGRATGHLKAFDVVDDIPKVIAPSLSQLFQPHREHRKLFEKILRQMEKGEFSSWFLARNFFAIKKSFKALPDTYFGLCSGLTEYPGDNNRLDGLSEWLDYWIEKAAHRLNADGSLPEEPLTFGMLREKGITLRTVATNLSQQVPIQLPNLGHFYIRKEDAVRLVPPRLRQYLARISGDDVPEEFKDDYFKMPDGDALPVLFAVRMSLSFPLLLSAIPLYRKDYTYAQSEDAQKILRCCWISDGGISSNFPIHLFDSPMALRPTFGITLGDFHIDRNGPDPGNIPGKNRVYLPISAGSGRLIPINEYRSILKFVYSIFSSAQNWADVSQSILPGYRERIVRVALKENEGGLNLTMPEDVINDLVALGECAGQTLNQSFSFDEHRWRRILSAYSALEASFEEWHDAYHSANPEGMKDFLARYGSSLGDGEPIATSYKPSQKEFDELQSRIAALMALASQWKQKPIRSTWGAGSNGMPKPHASVQFSPLEGGN